MKGLVSKETTIDGATYQLTVLPATQGSEVLAWMLGVVGDPAGKIFSELGTSTPEDTKAVMERVVSSDLMSTVMGQLGKELAKPGTVPMIKLLLESLQVKEKKTDGTFVWMSVNYDFEFAGNYAVLSKVVWFALDLNFRSFLVGNTALAALIKQAV